MSDRALGTMKATMASRTSRSPSRLDSQSRWVDEMKTKVGDQRAAKYEAGFSKYPLGRYRDRVGTNVEAVYQKVVKKA